MLAKRSYKDAFNVSHAELIEERQENGDKKGGIGEDTSH